MKRHTPVCDCALYKFTFYVYVLHYRVPHFLVDFGPFHGRPGKQIGGTEPPNLPWLCHCLPLCTWRRRRLCGRAVNVIASTAVVACVVIVRVMACERRAVCLSLAPHFVTYDTSRCDKLPLGVVSRRCVVARSLSMLSLSAVLNRNGFG